MPEPELYSGSGTRGAALIALTTTLWIVNVVIDTGGQVAFKCAARVPAPVDTPALWRWTHAARAPWIGAGVICYVVEFVAWLAFLSVVPLSRGVLLATLNIVVLAVVGRFLFQESLTRWRMAGIALIAIGVAVVGLDAQ